MNRKGAGRRWVLASVVVIFSVHGAGTASAHPSGPVGPENLWRTWAADPWTLLALGAAAWIYARGAGKLWARAGRGRGIPTWRFYCYAAGLVMLFGALVSPLDPLGGTLFSAHMVQHELLIVAAAPLIVLGTPLVAFAWAVPRRWLRSLPVLVSSRPMRRGWSALTHPAAAWSLHAAAIWTWHAPVLYQATLDSRAAHLAQHLSFFGTALLFWWALLRPGVGRRVSGGIAIFYLFSTAAYGSALGALLTFSAHPWYPAYAENVSLWGISPLEDQQLGGLIMWIPFGTLYTLAALAIFGVWLSRGTGRPRSRAPGLPTPAPSARPEISPRS